MPSESITMKDVIAAARAAGIPTQILQEPYSAAYTASVGQRILHSTRTWCRTSGNFHGRETKNPVTVTLADLETKPSCHCVVEDLVNRYRWQLGWKEQLLAITWDVSNLVPKMERLSERFETGKGRRPAVGLVGKLTRDAAEVYHWIELIRNQKPTGNIPVYIDDLETKLVDALQRVRKGGKSSSHQGVLLEKIQRKLVPDNWEGELPEVDETQMLVGFAPPPRGANQQLQEVLSTFAISTTSETHLMEVPRYVYDWLQRAFTPGCYPRMQLQAVEHPGDEIVETVKGLWNPADGGALRDLRKAVEAAKILEV